MKKSTGFALPAVIFFLIVVAAIVAAMSKMAANQSGSTSLSLQGIKANYAAKSGVEWASFQVASDSTWCASTTLNLTDALSGFVVTVTCTARNSFIEGGKTVVMYDILSTARYGNYSTSPDYAYRQISAVLTTES
jgi:MSHA biogenesis protein MshP